MRRIVHGLIFVSTALPLACVPSYDPEHAEHGGARVTLEGEEVLAQLDAHLTSAPIEAEVPFERVGIMWDAPDEAQLEIRTSADGIVWSAWSAPEVFFSEEGAHAGKVEAEGLASYYQWRVADAAFAPSYVTLEAIEEVMVQPDDPAAANDPLEELPGEVDEAEGVGTSGAGLTTRIGSLTVQSRRAWGARSPRCSLERQSPTKVTIHHTVGPIKDSLSPQARLRQIQSFHMYGNGWCDIGYNFIVSRDGRVWRGRGGRRVGAHTAGANTGNVGISFIGTYTSVGITAKQKCNAAKLIRYYAENFSAVDLTRTDVKGHRQYGSTACPGNRLYSQLNSLVSTARNGCN